MIDAERMAEIRTRMEDAVKMCMCAVCLSDSKRRRPTDCPDCETAREFHSQSDIPWLLEQLEAVTRELAELKANS